MEKLSYLLAVLIGLAVSSSCSFFEKSCKNASVTTQADTSGSLDKNNYGAYLAGRVAHIRHDLNHAADYYIVASKEAPSNQMIPNQLYIMLTSQGRIDEAAHYAEIAQQNGDKSPFIYTIKAVYEAKQGNYEAAIENIKKCDNPFANAIFNPLLNAWNYAAMDKYDQAIKSLSTLLKNPSLKGMYFFHAGAISDYMGKTAEAQTYYDTLIGVKNLDLAVFPMQIISNFYLRMDDKDKALKTALLNKQQNNVMIEEIVTDIKKSNKNVKPILKATNVGLADALFGISLLLSQDVTNDDLSLLFASLASYTNPDYYLPQLLIADVLERKGIYKNANDAYDKISEDDFAYYTAQFQKAKNLIKLDDAAGAEKIFKNLVKKYPPNPDVFTNLGEVSRMQEKNKEAIQYYLKAIDEYPEEMRNDLWPIYFALGVSYDANKQYDLSEQHFRKVLEIKPNRITYNHLGYVLLQRGKNPEEALEMIIKAHNEAPEEGTIVDSLGWAFYKIGKYNLAIKYLEKASNLAPSEAVIYDHLGNAYWQTGRKDEAIYQWNHALGLKDKSGEINIDEVLAKIKNGITEQKIPVLDNERIEKAINEIKE